MILIALAAFGGGMLSGVLGLLDSREKFVWRKFAKSVGFAFLSGIGFAVTFSFTGSVETKDCFLAILGGAGVDSLSNRIMGSLRK